MAPSHYLNQNRLSIIEVLWNSPHGNVKNNGQDINHWNVLKIVYLHLQLHFPVIKWVNVLLRMPFQSTITSWPHCFPNHPSDSPSKASYEHHMCKGHEYWECPPRAPSPHDHTVSPTTLVTALARHHMSIICAKDMNMSLRMFSQSTITSWPHSLPSNHDDSLDKPPYVYRTSMQTLRMSSQRTITSWPHSLPSNHNDSLDKPPYVYRTSMKTLIARQPTTVWFTAWLQLYLKYNHTICYIGLMALGLVEWQPAKDSRRKCSRNFHLYIINLYLTQQSMKENSQGFTWFQVFCHGKIPEIR